MFSPLRRPFIALLTVAGLTATTVAPAAAEVAYGTGVEMGVGYDNAVGVPVTVNFGASRTEGIDALKRLRGEMWDINPPFDGRPLRDVAAAAGLGTRDAYVNAVVADGAMAAIAVQRAVEETANPWDHDRPGPSPDTFSAVWQKKAVSSTENLATTSYDAGLAEMILQMWGHGELDELRADNGGRALGAGHLHSQINPYNRGFGYGYVYSANADTGMPYSGAMAATPHPVMPDYAPSQVRQITLYRAARNAGEARHNYHWTEVLEGTEYTLEHTMNMWGGSGSITAKAPEVDGDKYFTVQVPGTLPNGQAAVAETQYILVKNRLSDQHQPQTMPAQTVREGLKLTLTEADLLAGLPAGTTVTVDGKPLSEWVAREVNADTDTSAALVYTYSDGSTDHTALQLTIRNKLADALSPTVGTPVTVVERQDTTLSYAGVPEGTKVDGLTFTAPAVDADTTVEHTVTFTYSDASAETVTVPVLVKDSLADQNPVTAPTATSVNENETATVALAASASAALSLGAGAPAGATLSGTTLNFNPGEMSGDKRYTVPVVYTYADGSTNTVDVVFDAVDTTPPGSSEGSSSPGGIVGIIIAVLGGLLGLYSLLKKMGIVH